jgi:hypothetical protein
VRDFTLEHLNQISPAQRQPYFDTWATIPALVAAAEVANSSKHFLLRQRATGHPKGSKTRAVRLRKAAVVNIYVNSAGAMKALRGVRTEVFVTLSDGQILELHAFTAEVLNYWKTFLSSIYIAARRQPFTQLAGK